MKTKLDPRHQHRIELFKKLFAISFQNHRHSQQKTLPIINRLRQIDRLIRQSAPTWSVDKIAKIDLAILRLSIYELLQQKEPKKVIIDEAIELAKEFGNEKSSKFINGVLAFILRAKEDTAPRESEVQSFITNNVKQINPKQAQ